MRSHLRGVILATVLLTIVPSAAAAAGQQFKTVEAKHFARAEGVELSPEFSDYLYAELRSDLGKTKLFSQVIGEGEVVDDADAPASVVVEGTLTEYKKGNIAKAALVGFGVGMRSLRLEATIYRRSDHKVLATRNERDRIPPQWDEKIMARNAAKHLTNSIKDSLKHGPGAS